MVCQVMDDGEELGWEAEVQQILDDTSVDTIECLLKIDKDCIQGKLQLKGLLNNDLHCYYMIRKRFILTEACVFVSKCLVKSSL